MSPTYYVNYAFQVADSEDKPDNERWGFGRVPIETEVEPTTDEDFKEIARTIGLKNGYDTVRLQHVAEIYASKMSGSDEDEILEGTIVDDSK